jgi:small-conductance mechanosensitive channel
MRDKLQAVSEVTERLLQPATLAQVAIVAVMVILGWWIAGLLRRQYLNDDPAPDSMQGRVRAGGSIIAPYALALLLVAMADGLMHAMGVPAGFVDVAVQLAGLLMLIRAGVYLLRLSLGSRARVKGWGTPITFVIWGFLALHLLGWGDTVVAALDGIGIQAGKTRISVWSVMKLLVTVSLFVVAAVWASRWLERRVLKLEGLAPNMRIGLAKFTQAFLIGLSVLVGLNAAGLDLTTLNVLTGAGFLAWWLFGGRS